MSQFLFEVHLTINSLSIHQLPAFVQFCQHLNTKAILIELPAGEYTQQPMMTYVKHGQNICEILSDIETLKPKFTKQGFAIIRTKIEIPAHQYEDFICHFTDTKGYFEWHSKVQFMDNDGLQLLKHLTYHLNINAHLSKNTLAQQTNTRFITYRDDNLQKFYTNIQKILDELNHPKNTHALTLLKQQAEYCVYDDKISLDKGWL